MTHLCTWVGFVLSVSGVLVCDRNTKPHMKGLGAIAFITGLALLLAAVATVPAGGAQ